MRQTYVLSSSLMNLCNIHDSAINSNEIIDSYFQGKKIKLNGCSCLYVNVNAERVKEIKEYLNGIYIMESGDRKMYYDTKINSNVDEKHLAEIILELESYSNDLKYQH